MTKIYEESCQLYIEQEIEEGIKAGKSAYSIGKEISSWVEKIFGRKVNPDAIKQRVLRTRNNVPNEINPTQKEETEERDESERIIDKVINHKPKEENREQPMVVMSEEFEEAYETFLSAIKNAKSLKWKTTSKEVALRYVNVLIDVITIK